MTRLTNTYAINVTSGQEFRVRDELIEMGLKPWLPMQLTMKNVPERKDPVWYERPYVRKLMFCTFPAVNFRDVLGLKHVIGQPVRLCKIDVLGLPARTIKGTNVRADAVLGLNDFKEAVEREYAAAASRRDDANWVCDYEPGQALLILEGAFEGFTSIFDEPIKRSKKDSAKLRVLVDIFGRQTPLQVAPSQVAVA